MPINLILLLSDPLRWFPNLILKPYYRKVSNSIIRGFLMFTCDNSNPSYYRKLVFSIIRKLLSVVIIENRNKNWKNDSLLGFTLIASQLILEKRPFR